MPRRAKPWWWEARNRWASTIGGIRYTAPASIGPRDEHAAWEWHRTLMTRVSAPSIIRASDVANAWYAWDAARVEAGDRRRRNHELAKLKLRRICETKAGDVRFGSIPAADVNTGHLDAIVRAWGSEGLSANYRRELAGIAKAIFRWASQDGPGRARMIPEYPFGKVALPPSPRAAPRFAGRGEAAAWLRWLWRSGLRDFALLQRCLVHTGARPSELATARWGDVAWQGHRDSAGHWMAIITRTDWKCARKTGKDRLVYVPARLRRALARRRADRGELIWRSPWGKEWTSSNLAVYTRRCRDAAIKAKVPIKGEGPDRLANYRWRHTAASSLCASNVPIPVIADLLGTSVQQIMRTYAHILGSHLGEAAETLSTRRRS